MMILVLLLISIIYISFGIIGKQLTNYLFFVTLLDATLTSSNSFLIPPDFHTFPIFNSLTFYLSTGLGILIMYPFNSKQISNST